MTKITCSVLTVSDRCSAGQMKDRSGPEADAMLRKMLTTEDGSPTIHTAMVPDDVLQIRKVITEWCASGMDLIVTTGGTGFSSRDVTPEAVSPLLDRRADTMAAVIINQGMLVSPLALLSRMVCGIRGRTFIITLPGSAKAVRECLSILEQGLPHALKLIRDDESEIKKIHCNNEEPTDESGVKVDNSIVGRARQSPFIMVDKNEALKLVEDIIRNKILPSLEEEIFGPSEALGRTCTKDVVANDPFPSFPASIKDGYAVRCGGSLTPRVHEYAATAGARASGTSLKASAQLVDEYCCVRISTGGVVPPGADAVVQVEDTMLLDRDDFRDKELRIELKKRPVPGQDIRPIGYDIARGHLLLAKGDRVNAAAVGTLVMAGVSKISVSRLPTVGVLSTGDELDKMPLSDSTKSLVGRIPDSNRPMLLALLQQIRVPTVDLGVVEDTKEALEKAILEAASSCDIIVTSGGVSMGEKDLIKAVLKNLGYKIHFGRVNIKPGKPTTFATEPEGRMVFALPGNPASAFVMFHIFVRSALRALGADVPIRTAKARLCIRKHWELDPRPEYLRGKATVNPSNQSLEVRPTLMQQSSSLLSCLDADVLIELPGRQDDRKVVIDGDVVDIIWI
ncbi:gephyrin-like isoform X1 [Varroa destructor]|uniref:MoaB/Mog domain-containing protein n=2 Tax=Varroa destructor TaxID=109461 RepID=A0A7M7JLN3_VARDE|nr:gephyrin-like isoform X1 [Varroa destructor]